MDEDLKALQWTLSGNAFVVVRTTSGERRIGAECHTIESARRQFAEYAAWDEAHPDREANNAAIYRRSANGWKRTA